jgi:prephenate dehydratase
VIDSSLRSVSKIIALGPKYTWSDLAARRYRELNELEAEIELINPVNKTEGIIEALDECITDGFDDVIGIVPIYNTFEGRVKDTLNPSRGLHRYRRIKIYDEFALDIVYCLATKKQTTQIKEVISHPQALGQCYNVLREMKVKTRESTSTSEAAKTVAASENLEMAALCPREAAEFYGLDIRLSNIQPYYDESSANKTLFVVLRNHDHEYTGNDKTTLTFELREPKKPGTLYALLEILSKHNISKTESMEKGYFSDYVFWLNVDEHRDKLGKEIEKMKAICSVITVHGSYPKRTP